MKDRLIRQLIPSMAVAARWPLLPTVLDTADRLVNGRNPRYAKLPPASLRMRIGVSNRILRNAEIFEAGQLVVRRVIQRSWVHDGSRILELGSGVGRNAVAFRDQIDAASYDGIDVDAQMVAWCREHLAGPTTRFHHADLFSAIYNPRGRPATGYQFPAKASSIDFSLGISVFSHLVTADAAHYAAELARTTAAGGIACHTFFLLDHINRRLGDRWTFGHELDGCWVENPKYPEAAVAFRQADVAEMFFRHGMEIIEVLDSDQHQQMVVFRRYS